MRVRAKKFCFAAGSRRQKGEEFDFTLGKGKKMPHFLEPVSSSAPVVEEAPAPEGGEPQTLGELAAKTAPPQVDEPETLADLSGDPIPDPEMAEYMK